ncbi:MAG: malectin domain-containing carbohydrate-binding protein [Pseudomonadota bacterium]
MYELNTDSYSPVDTATYDPATGELYLEFDWDKLLDINGEWSNGRHIDAVTFNGNAYPIIIHDDDGPRNPNGSYIFTMETMNNIFTINIGTGHDPADGSLEFGLSDREDGTRELYAFSMIETADTPDPEPEPEPEPEPQDVEFSVYLYDAQTDALIMELIDGTAIDASLVEGRDVTLVAETSGEDTESIVMSVGGVRTQTESYVPYALFGDARGDLNGDDFLAPGEDYAITLTAYDGNGGNGSAIGSIALDVSVTVVDDTVDDDTVEDDAPSLDAPTLVKAVNAGGEAFTAQNGVVYEADDFGNGRAYTVNSAIAGTEDDGLYQSERWNSGGFTYEVAVDDGLYDVELNFAEIWSGAQTSGKRVFDVYVENELVFNDLDVADEVGFQTALDLVGQVEVTDGALTIETTGEVQNPKMSGFAIWEADIADDQGFTVGSLYDDLSF